jgi:hypothetical protein
MPDISKMPPLPAAHYGKIEDQPKESATLPQPDDIDIDDDEDLPADPALIDMLGFDPDELEDEE